MQRQAAVCLCLHLVLYWWHDFAPAFNAIQAKAFVSKLSTFVCLAMQEGEQNEDLVPAGLRSVLVNFQTSMGQLGRKLLAYAEESLNSICEEAAASARSEKHGVLLCKEQQMTLLDYFKDGLNSLRLLKYHNELQPEVSASLQSQFTSQLGSPLSFGP